MNEHSRGFTLLEVLVAAAAAVVLGVFCVAAARAALTALHATGAHLSEQAQMGELLDRLQTDEDSAWAIFTPPSDVAGQSNADGHEVDFFNRDGKERGYFWAYDYNAAAKTLTRYLYGAPGGSATVDQTYAGVTGFYAQTYPLTALQDATSRIYSPLYANAALQNGAVHFFSSAPWIAGGNEITYVRVQSANESSELHLSTLTAPSGYIVVLNYTPSPSPSPALAAWPQFVELPMQGQSLQTSLAPVGARAIGAAVNALLGGAVADAAVGYAPCSAYAGQARAFTDASFSTPLANAVAPTGALPSGVSGSTDSAGCITLSSAAFTNGLPNVALYEPGYSGAFAQGGNACGLAVSIAATYPGNQAGPQAQLVSQASSTAEPACATTWQDNNSTPNSAMVTYEVAGCSGSYTLVGLGDTCDFGAQSTSSGEPPDCSTQGGGNSGGQMISDTYVWTVSSGPGTIITLGNGDGGVERTGTGAISIHVADMHSEQVGCPIKTIITRSNTTFTVSD